MSNVETKEQISIVEFKAWLTGLIRGKGGALPDLDDWKEIKKMLDKVQDESDVRKADSPSISPSIIEEIFRKKRDERENKPAPYVPWSTPNDTPPWKLVPKSPIPNFPRIGDMPTYVPPYIGDIVPLSTTGGCPGAVAPGSVWVGDDFSNLKERISSSISASSLNSIETLKTESVVSSLTGSLDDVAEKKKGNKRNRRNQRRLRGPDKVVALRDRDGSIVHKELMDQITNMIERNENGPEEKNKTKSV